MDEIQLGSKVFKTYFKLMNFKRNAKGSNICEAGLFGQLIMKHAITNLTCSIRGVVGVLFSYETEFHSVAWTSWNSLCSPDRPQTSSDAPASAS